jgi:23S rRNA (cytidine1920-2'-O)/16S rRNA (cytidine1409-2'-O)-methyltransferase
LEHAITTWGIEVVGKKCLDIGSSTGGFTDCLLQYGALHVDCVDVGTDQLHEKIKTDPRVSVYEKTDIRNFQGGTYDVIVGDISFISLTAIIPTLSRFCHPDTRIILLIKPQFEVGKEFLNKQGIVKNELMIDQCIENIKNTLIEYEFGIHGIIDSPVLGGDGNRECICYGTKK